jgi:hypothetical protein
MIVNGTYDETTGTFTFEYVEQQPSTVGTKGIPTLGTTGQKPLGSTTGVALPKRFTITLNASEVQKIPGAKIDEVSRIAYLDSSQLVKLNKAQEIEIEKPAPKSSIIDAAKWDPNRTTYQAEEPVEEPAYKKGMVVDKAILLGSKGIGLDPNSGLITFILPPNEQAVTEAGKGGILNPSFAVIVPKKSYIGSGMVTTAVAYDANTAQENLISDLIKENKVDEFKNLLLDKGFYESAGFQLPQVRSSIAQKGIADSFFRTATNAFLYVYSLQNYQNIIDDTEAFTYNDFANNFKPDFAKETAYIPSKRDADAEVDAAYIEYVGRRATDKEKQAFFSALQREASSNPVRSVPGMGARPDTTLGGFTEEDLGAFASEFTLATPGAEKYGEGFGGYKTFNNVLSSLVSDLENETQFINKPILGENPNAV